MTKIALKISLLHDSNFKESSIGTYRSKNIVVKHGDSQLVDPSITYFQQTDSLEANTTRPKPASSILLNPAPKYTTINCSIDAAVESIKNSSSSPSPHIPTRFKSIRAAPILLIY